MNIYSGAREARRAIPADKSFTLVGGCFDLIHVGHLHLLEYAATLEHMLVVAVLSDEYARSYKVLQRPIIGEKHRAMMVASMRQVDLVYISSVSPSSKETLRIMKPNSVVFGEETNKAEKMQARMANIKIYSPSTKVRLLPRYTEEGVSTGAIIEKIRKWEDL